MRPTGTRRRTTRAGMVLAAGALLAGLVSGCATDPTGSPDVATARSDGPDPANTRSAAASFDPDSPLKYSQCMREKGMTWFPDPDSDGRTAVRVPSSVNPDDLKKAEEACRAFSPDNGRKPQISAEDLAKARQMSQCMRDNGVPNFPDPAPDGGISIDGDKLGTGPGEPAFDKAEEICSQYLPRGRAERDSDGGGTADGGGA